MLSGLISLQRAVWFGLLVMTVSCNGEPRTAITQKKVPLFVPSPTIDVELLKQELIVRHREADRLLG